MTLREFDRIVFCGIHKRVKIYIAVGEVDIEHLDYQSPENLDNFLCAVVGDTSAYRYLQDWVCDSEIIEIYALGQDCFLVAVQSNKKADE